MISERRENRSDSSSESEEDSVGNDDRPDSKAKRERKTELQELLLAAKNGVGSLVKLSMIIRSSPMRDDYPKAAARYQFDPRWDIGHVMEKYGKSKYSEPWLIERMGKAITLRRQYLKYREEHHGKLSRDWDNLVRHTKGKAKDTITITHSAPLTKATTFYENIPPMQEAILEFKTTESQTSYEPTQFGEKAANTLPVPAHPEEAFDGVEFEYGEPFLCPFCYTEQQVKNRNDWKRHVYRDLKPYICTFKECDLKMFRSRHEWWSHELKIHRREFTCSRCTHKAFDSETSFRSHLMRSHLTLANGSQIEATVMKSSEPVGSASSDACHLCDDWEQSLVKDMPSVVPDSEPRSQSGSLTRFRRHLGRHMEQLALFALPSYRGEDDEEEHDSDNESNIGSAGQLVSEFLAKATEGSESSRESNSYSYGGDTSLNRAEPIEIPNPEVQAQEDLPPSASRAEDMSNKPSAEYYERSLVCDRCRLRKNKCTSVQGDPKDRCISCIKANALCHRQTLDRLSAYNLKQEAGALKMRGNLAMDKKNYALAVEFYTKALSIVPESHVYFSLRAGAHSSSGDFSSARADAEAAIRENSDYAIAYRQLGNACFALGDDKGSIDAYQKGIKLECDNSERQEMQIRYDIVRHRIKELADDPVRKDDDGEAPRKSGSGDMPDLLLPEMDPTGSKYPGDHPAACQICGLPFRSQLDLNRHLEKYHEQEGNSYPKYLDIKCICGWNHYDETIIVCENCNTWQHMECFYPGQVIQALIGDSHHCADCKPRALDRRRAIEYQRQYRATLGLSELNYYMAKPLEETQNPDIQTSRNLPNTKNSELQSAFKSFEFMFEPSDMKTLPENFTPEEKLKLEADLTSLQAARNQSPQDSPQFREAAEKIITFSKDLMARISRAIVDRRRVAEPLEEPWSPDEDAYLVELVNKQGPSDWVRIAQLIGRRSPKQCRERWHQHLKSDTDSNPGGGWRNLEEEVTVEVIEEESKVSEAAQPPQLGGIFARGIPKLKKVGTTFTLVVASSSPEVEKPLMFQNLPIGTSIQELKDMIRNSLPSRPAVERQRFIRNGKVMGQGPGTMIDLFGKDLENSEPQHLHLISARTEMTASEIGAFEESLGLGSNGKRPIKFIDAVGRGFSFPFHLVSTWEGMRGLIQQSLANMEQLGQHVEEGHYDLIGPNGEIILPQVWETMIEPGWNVTMHMWPIASGTSYSSEEKKIYPEAPNSGDGIGRSEVDDISPFLNRSDTAPGALVDNVQQSEDLPSPAETEDDQLDGSQYAATSVTPQNLPLTTTGTTQGSSQATETIFPQADMSSLVGLGFSRQEAVNALMATGGNVQFAAGLLFSDDESAQSTQPGPQFIFPPKDIEQLTSLGFTTSQVINALSVSSGNVEYAAELLLEGLPLGGGS